jgi:hypothetical protein
MLDGSVRRDWIAKEARDARREALKPPWSPARRLAGG